jgi:uncharacterized protein
MNLPSPLSPQDAFARLGTGETAALAAGLRPLAGIDGLLTATMVSPEFVDSVLWMDHVCNAETWDSLTLHQMARAVSAFTDRQMHIAAQLAGGPETYRPFLGSETDRLAAAADWAAGFRSGLRLQPEPWEPLFERVDVRAFFGVIFCLEGTKDLSDEDKASDPFAHLTPEERQEKCVLALEMLPTAIIGLATAYAELHTDEDGDLFADARLPYWRASPKIGRNEPCPCGSGKKYKKCCLSASQSPS